MKSVVSQAMFPTQTCMHQLFIFYQLVTFVPSTYACSKRAASAFAYAYKLLAWSHKPDPFCSAPLIASSTSI